MCILYVPAKGCCHAQTPGKDGFHSGRDIASEAKVRLEAGEKLSRDPVDRSRNLKPWE